MKVGPGNCFLKWANHLGGLWVGYDGDAIPPVSANGLCNLGTEQADLRFLSVVGREGFRDRVRICVYSKDHLNIFRPTGPLKYLSSKAKAPLDWRDPSLYDAFSKQLKDSVAERLGGVGSEKFISEVFGSNGWKLLPAELITSIDRSNLFASIDSLSVWQSFNRRTFQPMFTLKGQKAHSNLNWLNAIPSIDPIQVSEKEVLEEGAFGKLIRLYIESRAHKDIRNEFAQLSEAELIDTGFALLNPAQLETATFHLSADLGLTADVALGKGLDVADVKATARHLDATQCKLRIAAAIELLEGVGVKFSERLRSSIEATATIRFQCKARVTADNENLGTVLLVQPGEPTTTRSDCLYLDYLRKADHNTFPKFREWLRLLCYDLKSNA